MAEEMVIWVDEKGKVLGPIPISLANSDKKYLHLEVAVVIVDESRRVLFQKRAKSKKVAPGIWTIAAAGHITYGDTSEQTAHKELAEEMGITVKVLYHIFSSTETLERERHVIDWYLGEYRGGKIIVQDSEVETYAWVGEDQLSEFILSNDLSTGSVKVAKRYWTGEWDYLIK